MESNSSSAFGANLGKPDVPKLTAEVTERLPSVVQGKLKDNTASSVHLRTVMYQEWRRPSLYCWHELILPFTTANLKELHCTHIAKLDNVPVATSV